MPFFPVRNVLRIPILCGALVVSRYGLWGFDVAVVNIFQEQVPLEKMGRFNGIQESLNSLSEIAIAILAMILHKPSQFWLLALVSLASITTAAGLYSQAFPKLERSGWGCAAPYEALPEEDFEQREGSQGEEQRRDP